MNTARRNARGEASLQRILDATVQLVGRYGYDNTTIARITKTTQRPASSIYWYFRDKDELIAAALEHSYTRFARGGRSWQHYDPALPLRRQLIDELVPELRASESETPLRLGITLALEGSAARSTVQEPFQRRRAAALRAIEKWWESAFAAQGAARGSRTDAVWWASTLTLALLDGHYISDVIAVDVPTVDDRSRTAALALAAAFDVLHRGDGLDGYATVEADPAPRDSAEPPASGPASLLRVTCGLVAQHGYEGATIGRICAAADMQRSSVYWRYKDKDTLIEAAVAEPFLALFAPFHALPSEGSWSEQLAAAVGATLRAAHDDPDTVKAGLLLKVQQWDPPTAGGAAVLGGIVAVGEALTGWLARVMPPGECGDVPAEHIAWIVLRSMEGLMLGSALGRPVPVTTLTRLVAVTLHEVVGRWPVADARG